MLVGIKIANKILNVGFPTSERYTRGVYIRNANMSLDKLVCLFCCWEFSV